MADTRRYHPAADASSEESIRLALRRELEAAILQSDAEDISYIGRVLEVLETEEGIKELRGFSVRRSARSSPRHAVALLDHGELDSEPLVILLVQDDSAKS